MKNSGVSGVVHELTTEWTPLERELYEALDEARKWMYGIPSENGATCETKGEMVEMMDSALAKARGCAAEVRESGEVRGEYFSEQAI